LQEQPTAKKPKKRNRRKRAKKWNTQPDVIQLNNTLTSSEDHWKASVTSQIIHLLQELTNPTEQTEIQPTSNNQDRNDKAHYTYETDNIQIKYTVSKEKLSIPFSPEAINMQILQHIVMCTDPKATEHLPRDTYHRAAMKFVVKLLQNSRLPLAKKHRKQKIRRFNWRTYDPLHNLGLLLILLDKGAPLPRQPAIKVAKILAHIENSVWIEEPPGTAVVYYAFSTNSAQDYIGQTKQFTVRKHQETYEAKKLLARKKKLPGKMINARKLEKTMAKSDYTTWYHWPIRILGNQSTPELRIKHEKQLIQWLRPTLNYSKRGKIRSSFLESIQKAPNRPRKQHLLRCIHRKRKICRQCALTRPSDPPAVFVTMPIRQSLGT
jgi:hypothetical protein